jgi:hypothetical protein
MESCRLIAHRASRPVAAIEISARQAERQTTRLTNEVSYVRDESWG